MCHIKFPLCLIHRKNFAKGGQGDKNFQDIFGEDISVGDVLYKSLREKFIKEWFVFEKTRIKAAVAWLSRS